MKTAERVKQALEEAGKQVTLMTEQNIKCIEFVKRMEKHGVLHTDKQSNTPLNEGGREQLKLYAIPPINL